MSLWEAMAIFDAWRKMQGGDGEPEPMSDAEFDSMLMDDAARKLFG